MLTIELYPLDIRIKPEQSNSKRIEIELLCKDKTNVKKVFVHTTTNDFYIISSNPDETLKSIPKHEHFISTELVEKDYFGDSYQAIKIQTTLTRIAEELVKELKTLPNVIDILEADLPLVRKYLVQNHIIPFASHECHIEENKITSITPTNTFLMFHDVSTIAFDIETYSTSKKINSQKNPILSIALYGKDVSEVITWAQIKSKHSFVTIVKNETELIQTFFERLNQLNPDIVCGYNSDAFDFAYIKDRCEILKIKPLVGQWNSPLHFYGGKSTTAYIEGMAHIDLFPFIRVTMKNSLKTSSYSLDNVSAELLHETKKEVDISQLYKAWDTKNTEKLDEFLEYNLHDCVLCYKLLEILFPNILEFAKMINLPLDQISRMTYSQLVEWFLINRAQEFNTLVPNKASGDELERRLREPKNEGAFVFTPIPGFYTNVAVFDFQSLYPSIIASLNLEGATLNRDKKHKVPEIEEELYFSQEKVGFIPSVIKDIVMRRVQIKQELKTASADEKEMLKARIYNLKILANSMYGYLAFVYARWHSNKSAAATTAYARHFIKFTIEKAKKAGFHVIYGDTDSIFLELRNKTQDDAQEFVTTLNKEFPGIMELQFEDFFDTGIFVPARGSTTGAKKRYALYNKKNDKFKITGLEFVRGDWSVFAKQAQEELISLLLKEQKPQLALEFVRSKIDTLEKGNIPITDLAIHVKLSRDLDQYDSNLPHVIIGKQLLSQGEPIVKGSLISYVVIKGKGNLYERVKPVEQASFEEIDTNYYIQNQLLAVTLSLLSIFNITQEDILSQTKQQGLGSWM